MQGPDPHEGWTVTDYLLANEIDLLQAANWQRENANLEKGKVPTRRPRPMYRPAGATRGGKTQEQREREWAERAARYERERLARGN